MILFSLVYAAIIPWGAQPSLPIFLVYPGEIALWTLNVDSNMHSIVHSFPAPSLFTSGTLQPGATFSFRVPNRTGTLGFTDGFNSSTVCQIKVVAVTTTTALATSTLTTSSTFTSTTGMSCFFPSSDLLW
jgi:hypothetical protein